MPETDMDWAEPLNASGLVMLGCGHMGGAMLAAWLEAGLRPDAVHIINRSGISRFADQGVRVNEALPDKPAMVILAVKPQIMGEAIGQADRWAGQDVPYLSVAAGLRLASFEGWLSPATPILRAMPNMPVSIGKGMTPLICNDACAPSVKAQSEAMMRAMGETAWLRSEDEMDAVTAVSGSGPGYLYHMIEALAAAAEAEGLAPETAMVLARATISGASALAENADDIAEMRRNIAISGGTTEAGLAVLMDDKDGLRALMRRTVGAAAARSREIAESLT